MVILVVGGTGTVGSEVVERLVGRGASPRVVTRSPGDARRRGPAEASYVEGDLAEPESLGPAFDGAEKLFLLTPLHPDEAELGRAAVAAAERAGVGHVVFQSIHRVEAVPEPPHFRSKIEITGALRESGLPHTLIRPNNFHQNDLRLREAIVAHGVYSQPLGPVGVSRVDARDIAEAVVNALLEPGHEGRIYPLVGPEPVSGPRAAETWEGALDREVVYAGDDLDAWAEGVEGTLPAWLVEDLRVMYRHFQENGWVASAEELDHQREVLGREPRSFGSFARETAERWLGA